jgi:hypothetical protein
MSDKKPVITPFQLEQDEPAQPPPDVELQEPEVDGHRGSGPVGGDPQFGGAEPPKEDDDR